MDEAIRIHLEHLMKLSGRQARQYFGALVDAALRAHDPVAQRRALDFNARLATAVREHNTLVRQQRSGMEIALWP